MRQDSRLRGNDAVVLEHLLTMRSFFIIFEYTKRSEIMKILYTIAFFVSLFCLYSHTKAEPPKTPPFQKHDPMESSIGEDEIIRYEHLLHSGDYSKLDFIIRTNKKEYALGEPVYIRFYVRNNSEEDIHINMFQRSLHFTHLWKLVDSKNERPAWTRHGEKLSKSNEKQLNQNANFFFWGIEGGLCYIKLKPGQEFALHGVVLLNLHFDLTIPDTYELQCCTKTFIHRQIYDQPLRSNTVKFAICEASPFNVRDIKEPGDFDNPRPGEEVFEKPVEEKSESK